MFPMELKRLTNWVGWLKDSKIPMNPLTRKVAMSNERTTWGTYEQATQAASEEKWGGIGFMLEPPYIGIDLDDCIKDGQLNGFARDIIKQCRSYAEYSPSKTGIHILGRGVLGASLKKPFIEVYQNQRYFTVTEQSLYPILPLKDIDLAFLDQYRTNGHRTIESSWVAESLANLKPGTFHNESIRIIGKLHHSGWTETDILALLQPHIEKNGGDIESLKTRIQSIGKYAIPPLDIGQGISVDEFLANSVPVEWICKPFIAEQAIGFIAGLPESRKSWILIDLAIECARGGGMWLKRFPVKGCKVLLIDQERSKSEVQRRIQAVIAGKEMSSASLKGALFVRSGTTTRIDLQSSYDALCKELFDIKPDLILIDTFATFHTKNESNRMEIQQVMERIKELRNEFKCSIIFAHHETKQSFQNKKDGAESSYLDMSGNVAIPAAAEFTMNVVKHDEESSFVYHTKSTQCAKAPPFLVKVIDLDAEKSKISVEAY